MAKRWSDPLVEEVRQRGRAYTERLGHDIHAIMEDLRRHQREHPARYVSRVTVVPGSPEPPPRPPGKGK